VRVVFITRAEHQPWGEGIFETKMRDGKREKRMRRAGCARSWKRALAIAPEWSHKIANLPAAAALRE